MIFHFTLDSQIIDRIFFTDFDQIKTKIRIKRTIRYPKI